MSARENNIKDNKEAAAKPRLIHKVKLKKRLTIVKRLWFKPNI
jgi:hypothetical protein